MSYKIDLDNMCRSIESDISIESYQYIDENIRSVEWKMKESEFNSKRKDLEAALGKLHDATKSNMDKILTEAANKAVAKIKKKNPNIKEADIIKGVKASVTIVDKSKFIKDEMDYILSDRKSDIKGAAILIFDSKKMADATGTSRMKDAGKILGPALILSAIGGALIGSIQGLLVSIAGPLCFLLGGVLGASARLIFNKASNYGKIEDGAVKDGNKAVKDNDIKKYFSVAWDYDSVNLMSKKALFNKDALNYAKSEGSAKLMVVPKFKIKLGK